MKQPVVVSDSGPLIALARSGHLNLLPLVFGRIHLPESVLRETTADSWRPGAVDIDAFVAAHVEVHADSHDGIYVEMKGLLDEGEAQALNLAEKLGCAVLIDERRGRLAARNAGLAVVGVLGVLLQARKLGAIEKVLPIIERMRENGYRFSDPLVQAVLQAAGE
ncbi:MAG: DUF3368 domain-containing protein [Lautropia sp.]|nr:DUF3368 domain-containing protein [Lautropia sp.]